MSTKAKETNMSVKGEIKEGAGFLKEEMNEHGKSPESQRKAQEGRNLRNEAGRRRQGAEDHPARQRTSREIMRGRRFRFREAVSPRLRSQISPGHQWWPGYFWPSPQRTLQDGGTSRSSAKSIRRGELLPAMRSPRSSAARKLNVMPFPPYP